MIKVIGGRDIELFIPSKTFQRLSIVERSVKQPIIVCANAVMKKLHQWKLEDIFIPKQEVTFESPRITEEDLYKRFSCENPEIIVVPMFGIIYPYKKAYENTHSIKTALRSLSEEFFFMSWELNDIVFEYYNYDKQIEDRDVYWTIDSSDWKLDEEKIKTTVAERITPIRTGSYGFSSFSRGQIGGLTSVKQEKPKKYVNANINKENPSIEHFGSGMFSFDAFKLLLQADQENLRRYFSERLKDVYGDANVTSTLDYVYCKGNAPVMLVAHMDIKHKHYPLDIYFDKENSVIWSPTGIGGDDRCGLYLILQILNSAEIKDKPSILLTTDEEIGCLGAKVAAKELKGTIGDLKYIIELDRQGKDDVVFYDTTNKDFIKFCKEFGFTVKQGMSSDIRHLTNEWGIASCNVSVGYYNEHEFHEYVKTTDMMDTFAKVVRMVLASSTAPCYKDK